MLNYKLNKSFFSLNLERKDSFGEKKELEFMEVTKFAFQHS